jgi:hypothetical protein
MLLTLALHQCEWPASCLCCFITGWKATSAIWIGGCVSPRACVDALETIKLLVPAGNQAIISWLSNLSLVTVPTTLSRFILCWIFISDNHCGKTFCSISLVRATYSECTTCQKWIFSTLNTLLHYHLQILMSAQKDLESAATESATTSKEAFSVYVTVATSWHQHETHAST